MKKAFTLSEVLIVVGLIGVVAALTIPNVYVNYNKKVYTTQLKKTYSLILSAIGNACAEQKVSKFYMTSYASNSTLFLNTFFKGILNNGTSTVADFAPSYKSIKGGINKPLTSIGADYIPNSRILLDDGQVLAVSCSSTQDFCWVLLDINGKHGPNIAGRDFFRFKFSKTTNEIFDTSSSCDVTNISGNGCLGQILNDNWVMKY